MRNQDYSPKGILRDDHILLLGDDLAALSSRDLRVLIADVLNSVHAFQPAASAPETELPLQDFLAKSVSETKRMLQSASTPSRYQRLVGRAVAC